jgi:hypothetical protein
MSHPRYSGRESQLQRGWNGCSPLLEPEPAT